MARRREEQEQAADRLTAAEFPYADLMAHPAWAAVDAELGDLEANDDLELTTARRYVVGALVRRLVDTGLTFPAVSPLSASPNRPDYRWVLQVEVGHANGRKRPTARNG